MGREGQQGHSILSIIPDKLLFRILLKAQRFGRIAAMRCFVFFFNWIYICSMYILQQYIHSMDTFYICIHVNYMICKLVKYRQIHIRFTSLKQACSMYRYCIIHCTIYYTSYSGPRLSGPAHFLIRVIFFLFELHSHHREHMQETFRHQACFYYNYGSIIQITYFKKGFVGPSFILFTSNEKMADYRDFAVV